MLSWLNANGPSVSAFASAASAFAALAVVMLGVMTFRLNQRLARENGELRKAEGDPQVIAYVTINPRVFSALDFVLANIGKGAARNVSFKIVSGGSDIKAKNVRLLNPDTQYSFLLAGQQLSSSMGMGFELLAPPMLQPFDVEVSYENTRGEKSTSRYKIDISQFDGMGRLGQAFDEKIADGVMKIATEIEGWRTQRLKVETMSLTEKKQHDAEVRSFMEERRKLAQQKSEHSS